MQFSLDSLPKLDGQKVLVTGASGVLGQEIAALFAACGAAVAVHARSDSKALAAVEAVTQRVAAMREDQAVTQGLKLMPVAADLSDSNAAEQLIAAANSTLTGLTGLINCAAVQPVVDFAELDEAAWGTLLQANLTAAHLLTRAASECLPAGGWVTHISSIEGARPAQGHTHYAVSKAALQMHAQASALELGAKGIRVNTVAPGLIARPGIAAEWPSGVESWLQHAPLRRLVDPADVAAACVFFASPAAGAITGQTLAVDCGMLTTPGW